jgi:PAS domain S-box-containing protein
MSNKNKTKEQLIKELTKLHQENAELKKEESARKKIVEELQKRNRALNKELKRRERVELALRESEGLYKTLVKASPDSISVVDLNGYNIELSQQSIKLLGYTKEEELLGRHMLEHIAPEDHEKAKATFQETVEKGITRNAEIIFQRKDRSRFIGEASAAMIKDAFGRNKAMFGIIRDITERKKMEEKLKQYSKDLEQKVQQRTQELKYVQKEVDSLRKQIKKSRRYPEIIGNSPEILHVIDLVNQIARTDSTILIYGETGSGKDLIAQAIHHNSSRKDAPFLSINCAALPEQLIESELFGYVKGAFTGASQNKKGLFEEAHNGTIFLNEVGDIPLRLQGKLLDAIENQQIRRLGQSKSIGVNVRIISATNKDLKEATKKKRFREDLYYRLNVLPIKIPPLRERKEDIPLLVRYFLDKYCPLMDKEIRDISPKGMEMLCNYSYPGNVRELENIIQHSIIMAQGTTISPAYLPEELQGFQAIKQPESIAEMEKQLFETTVKKYKGNLDEAAKQLGIGRTTLWRKMKKYGIKISE